MRVFVRSVPGGATLVLDGTAAFIWTVAATGATDVVSDIAQLVGQPAHELRSDVEDFLSNLVAQGLLERHQEEAG